GWRPVIGSGGLLYGSINTAQLHSPYKIPASGLEMYHSSARPFTARDVNKLTSIAQSYHPTTLRTVPITSHNLPPNQPINSYLNPFALPNNLNQYKFLQNYPIDSNIFRNQHHQYSVRPVLKNTKQKQYHNNIGQISNAQSIQYGQYNIPLDIYGKIDYPRPDGKRPQSSDTEIYKTEVFKLPDTDTASQFIAQPVKTAHQQHTFTSKLPINQYGHPFQDNVYNMQQFPSILGGITSFSPMINNAVHVIMYSYYLMSSEGSPKVKAVLIKYKKWMTIMQMIQFTLMLIYSAQVFLPSCPAPLGITFLYFPNVIFVYYMFYKFFRQNYIDYKKKQQNLDQNGTKQKYKD
ncbi:jg5865, partial [Pararge aegeria aegeria]